eukprot:SAG22_NODE_164_length_16817_cov_61.573573_11_plen_184_part_00
MHISVGPHGFRFRIGFGIDACPITFADGGRDVCACLGVPLDHMQPVEDFWMLPPDLPLAKLAWPLSLTFGLQQASQQVNIMFVGQLGPTQLGAVVLATMWANISGTSIVMGGMTALDSLASQAFGAGEFHTVGILLQRCAAIITLLTVPICASPFHPSPEPRMHLATFAWLPAMRAQHPPGSG